MDHASLYERTLTKKKQDQLKKTAQQTGVVLAWSRDDWTFAGVLTTY